MGATGFLNDEITTQMQRNTVIKKIIKFLFSEVDNEDHINRPLKSSTKGFTNDT